MQSEGVLHLRGHVLVGPDEEVGEAWVLGGRVTFERPVHAGVPFTEIEGWVIPGLVDAHNHIGLDARGATDQETAQTQARTDLAAGTMLIRDCGSPADTRWVDQREDLPRIVRAGRHIARTSRYIRGIGHEVEPEHLAEYVRAEAARGDGWVKLVGDWIDRDLGDLAPCWPLAALREAMDAAHAAGARVTAHCFGEDCLPDLIEAGIDCIEHASGLADDALVAAAARGVAIVPTLVNIANFPAFADAGEAKYPTYGNHMRRLHSQRYDTVRDAFDVGLPIFAGTDAGGSLPHGLIAAEVAELVTAGIPATSALDGACWGARSWLDRPGLEEAESADLLVYPEDPRRDVGVLAHPRLRVLRGRSVT
ncbi:MAG: amidohydrolase family protein [Kineosporiaceae bacterium]|jgi:imidazolonepropionase-like amidohydrolase